MSPTASTIPASLTDAELADLEASAKRISEYLRSNCKASKEWDEHTTTVYVKPTEEGIAILEALPSLLIRLRAAEATARPTAPAATAEASMLAAVERFDQISNGDTLLIRGNIDGAQWHCFPNIQKKNTPHDGQGVILKKKGNVYFNFGMYAAGDSWVKECFLLTSPAPPTT